MKRNDRVLSLFIAYFGQGKIERFFNLSIVKAYEILGSVIYDRADAICLVMEDKNLCTLKRKKVKDILGNIYNRSFDDEDKDISFDVVKERVIKYLEANPNG